MINFGNCVLSGGFSDSVLGYAVALAQVFSHGLSPWRRGFDPSPVCVRCVVDREALEQTSL